MKTKIITIEVDELVDLIGERVKEELKEMSRPRVKPYSGKEVDELFGITSPTRNNWKNEGIIEPFSVGGRVYYTVESVQAHLKSKSK